MKNILELNSVEAKDFFLKSTSFCSIDLPPYINFDRILKSVYIEIGSKTLHDCCNQVPKDDSNPTKTKADYPSNYEGVCYKLLSNKDGKYAWRPLQIIHPIIYCLLVRLITEEENWLFIKERFCQFVSDNIECVSIPVISTSEKTGKAEAILSWWNEVEQKSLKLSLDYDCVLVTDITDCYSAIYTHSIAWALHTKEEAKKSKGKGGLLGDDIDVYIREMMYGQTNGIPQGSIVMDFIAEMVLGYADTSLATRLADNGINNYKIIRYRDDYRIFSNNPHELELIAKSLSEILADLGLKLNSGKTHFSADIVRSSIKSDKLYYISNTPILMRNGGSIFATIQKELLYIYDFSSKFPNSGTIQTLLTKTYKNRIMESEKIDEDLHVLISIMVEIVYKNPRFYSIGFAIVAKLMKLCPDEDHEKLVSRIKNKFQTLPNIGIMQLWLQRLSKPLKISIGFDELICKLVDGHDEILWCSDWLHSTLKQHIKAKSIVDVKRLEELSPMFELSEISIFEY